MEAFLAEETKFSLLNQATLKIADRADPFPAVPKEIKGKSYSFSFPIIYEIRETP